jgi:hypothetical protein
MAQGTTERLNAARIAGLWFLLAGPPLAAFLQQQLTYMMVTPACERRLPWLVHLPLLPGLLLIGLAGVIARREWQRAGQQPSTDVGGLLAASRLFSLVGFALCGLALALILAQWLPTLFLDPCQR